MTSHHHDTIRDQFTRQAMPFSTAPAVLDEEALKVLVEAAGAGPADTVLDVACGPGIVACAFARAVRHATGIDLTPAMIDRAREIQKQQGHENVSFRVGDVLPLPFADGSFSIVTCRYSFHHFLDPLGVLREMKRVCGPGGRVAVADVMVSPDPAKAAAFNRMERLRDASHVRGMPLSELIELFSRSGLGDPRKTFYDFAVEVDGLLEHSFPEPENIPVIRRMFEDSLRDDGLGMRSRRDGGTIRCVYPIAVLVAERARN